jgi:uncharacterized protein
LEIREVIILPEVEQKLIWKHQVFGDEVEDVFEQSPHIRVVQKGKLKGQNLYVALGRTQAGRYLSVFFINKSKGVVTVISARDMDKKERKLYGKIGK